MTALGYPSRLVQPAAMSELVASLTESGKHFEQIMIDSGGREGGRKGGREEGREGEREREGGSLNMRLPQKL